ncbi:MULTISPECIES: toxin-antitoxin system YwqK family antitoxin [unclassified Flavobacterium]|uniref:toxin-antitoxin system YwqK family antitoxin n=1 Tax=unclassified Flavobacterium TaxID=196869 RepID=UPI000F0CB301|nr:MULTISPECIES: hypothetical protein [unclassified Flavobacterium]AYN03385.1 hypothetical protein EAG11_03750 [Flavobacterium sp. 140616W15]MCD0476062.1 hypothetical protein [Flavobacterium sp. EDS]
MIRINFNDDSIEIKHPDAGGGSTYFYQGVPFTGIIEEFHNNGNLIGEIEVKNGYTDGRIVHYYDNGQLQEEKFKKFNRLYNTYKYWDEQGNLILHIIHDNNGDEIQRVIG